MMMMMIIIIIITSLVFISMSISRSSQSLSTFHNRDPTYFPLSLSLSLSLDFLPFTGCSTPVSVLSRPGKAKCPYTLSEIWYFHDLEKAGTFEVPSCRHWDRAVENQIKPELSLKNVDQLDPQS